MEDFTSKKDRIVDAFLEGLIDRKNRDLRLSKLSDEMRLHTEQESRLKARKMALERILENKEEDAYETFLAALEKMSTDTIFNVVHQHIESLTAVPISYGKKIIKKSGPCISPQEYCRVEN